MFTPIVIAELAKEDTTVYADFLLERAVNYNGGMITAIQFIRDILGIFPTEAGQAMSFRLFVEKDGSISNVELVRDGDMEFAEEAKSVMEGMIFIPRLIADQPVRSTFILPIKACD